MRISWSYIILLCLLALMACETNEPTVESSTQKTTEKKILEVKVQSVTAFEITIYVKHNYLPNSGRIYYATILTNDSIDSVTEYTDRYIDQYGREFISEVVNSGSGTFKYSNLLPNTTYHFIVYTVDTLGQITGEPLVYDVCTLEADTHFEINPNWNVEWKGNVIYEDIYKTQVKYNVLNDTILYYTCLIPEKKLLDYKSIDNAIYWAINREKKELKSYEDWMDVDMLFKKSTNVYYAIDPGYYYALMIGVTEDGTPTGLYAMSDKEYVDAYPMLPDFQHMLGQWKMMDAEGRTDTVQIKTESINYSYSVTGWAGRSWPVIINYTPTMVHKRTLYQQTVATNVVDTDGTLRHNVLLYPWYLADNGVKYRVRSRSTIAYIDQTNDDIYVIDKALLFYDHYEVYGLHFYDDSYDGDYLTLSNSSYTFPIVLTRL